MASAVARAYSGGLGTELPAGSRGRAPGQGVKRAKPPETQAFLVFGRSMEAANLLGFLKFGNAKNRYLCYLCKKIMGGHETGRPGAKLGACASSPPPARV